MNSNCGYLCERSFTPTAALPSLSSGHTTASPQSPLALTPVSSLIQGLSLDEITSGYRPELEFEKSTSEGSNVLAFSTHNVWHDFMVTEPMSSSDIPEYGNFQIPAKALRVSPDQSSHEWRASPVIHNFTTEDKFTLNYTDAVESNRTGTISSTLIAYAKTDPKIPISEE